MGHARRRPQARRRDRDEPADRRDPGDGQPADATTTTPSPGGSATRLTRSSSRTRTSRSSTTRCSAQYPPGSTYKLVTGTGALTDHKITPTTRVTTKPYLLLGKTKFWDWNHRGWGPITIHERLRPLERHVLLPAGRHARASIDSPTGRTSTASARRPASTCPARSPASSRRTPGSRPRSAQTIFPGEVLQAGIGQGYRRRHADPADQRLCGARQRRQALPAADRPRDHRSGRLRRPALPAEADPPPGRAAQHAQDDAPRGAQRRPRPSRCRSSSPSTISSLPSHCTGKKSTRSLPGLDARTSPEVLTPKGVTMASRTATNALIHAGGSPTVRVASTRMLRCFDELKSML